MTKAFVLPAAMLMAMLAPAMAQTASPEAAPTPPAAASPAVTTPASPGAPTSAAPETGSTTGSTTATTTLGSTARILTVDALEDRDIVGADGKEIGDIEGVVENNADKKQFVVIERGGFLGFGAKTITVPLENVAVQGEKVTLRNMDVAQLDGLAEFNNDNNAFRDLDDAQQINLTQQ
jgi:sporulation protein YlmC with PRC-barrel domain